MMSLRSIALVLLVFGGLIAGAWLLDSKRNQPPGRVVVGESGQEQFVIELPPEVEGSDIVVHCNEKKYQKAFGEFRAHLGIEAEPWKMPGGPLAIGAAADHVSSPEVLAPLKRSVVEILKRRSPKRIVLIAHDRCIYYDTAAAWKDQRDQVNFAQGRHLRLAREKLAEWFPEAEVESYFAMSELGELIFEKVPD